MCSALTPYQTQYIPWELSHRMGADDEDLLVAALVDAQVDLNPHSVEAALLAFQNRLAKSLNLADEAGLGKTIKVVAIIEEHQFVSGIPNTGGLLREEDATGLPKLPTRVPAVDLPPGGSSGLVDALLTQERVRTEQLNRCNMHYFEAETQKLDSRADYLTGELEDDGLRRMKVQHVYR